MFNLHLDNNRWWWFQREGVIVYLGEIRYASVCSYYHLNSLCQPKQYTRVWMTFFVGIWFQGSLLYKYMIRNDILWRYSELGQTHLKQRMIGKTASNTEGATNNKEMESTLNSVLQYVQHCIVTFIREISSSQASSYFLQPIWIGPLLLGPNLMDK